MNKKMIIQDDRKKLSFKNLPTIGTGNNKRGYSSKDVYHHVVSHFRNRRINEMRKSSAAYARIVEHEDDGLRKAIVILREYKVECK